METESLLVHRMTFQERGEIKSLRKMISSKKFIEKKRQDSTVDRH
jgi:hypothetical protein